MTPLVASPRGRDAGGTGRLAFLDGIRALAAVAVVLHHAHQTVTTDGSLRRYLFFLGYGNFAVAVFIVLSGYSLTVAAARRGFSQPFWVFIRRRAWRILPPYVAALVLSVVLIVTVIGSPTGTPWDLVLPLSWTGVAVNLLLLQDVVTARAPNHVFWSIAVEWHLYLLFPLLLALRRRLPRSCLLVVGALGCGLLWPGYAGQPYVGFPPQFFGLFVVGILAGDLATDESRRARDLRSRLRLGWAVVAVALAAVAGPLLVRADPTYFVAELVLGGAVGALLVALATGPVGHPARRCLEWRPLAWAGVFSYSLYLAHAPVVQLVWQHGVRPLPLSPSAELAATLLAATGASLAVAFLFHLAFERPFMNHRSLRELARALRRNPRPSPPAPNQPSGADDPYATVEGAGGGSSGGVGAGVSEPGGLVALGVALADPDAGVRARAVETLPVAGNRRALDQVLAAAEDAEGVVRAAAYQRLAVAPTWVLWIALGRCTRRVELLGVVGEEGGSDRVVVLVGERMASPDVGDRVLALEVAGHLGVPALLAKAVAALTDPQVEVRRAATSAVAGWEQAVPPLLAVLGDDPDATVRRRAAAALADPGTADGVLAGFLDALQDPDTEVRRLAADALVRHRSAGLADRLAARLTTSNLDSVGEVVLAMGEVGQHALVAVVVDGPPGCAAAAARLLRTTDIATRLHADLKAVDPAVRLQAVVVLGALGGPVALDALVTALSDPRPAIRAHAARSLRQPDGRHALQRAADSDLAPEVQQAATHVLRTLDNTTPTTNGAATS